MVAQMDWQYIRTRPTRMWSRALSYSLFEGRPVTTRGRWANPAVFSLLNLLKRIERSRKSVAPIFIVGTGRSGTTILGVVLSMHKAVGFLNEPKAIWASLRNDEDLIGSYHLQEARYRLDPTDATQKMMKESHRIYGAYLAITGSGRVVEKYPELIFRVPFLLRLFPDAKFLFLSRDGRDTCASINQWSTQRGSRVDDNVHDWWGVNRRKWNALVDQVVSEHPDLAAHASYLKTIRDQRAMAATEWIVSMREGIRLLQTFPDRVMSVPYRNLCVQPRAMCERIAAFTQLPRDEVFLQYAESVLSPTPAKGELELPDFLEKPFRETCEACISLEAE